ncbi:MAG: diadenylate cyclase CdaA [Syntrophorhabdaceae bacterium]|nr:diadenylate cyclase CdaA [Syntrophorhabdaceae bacterium]
MTFSVRWQDVVDILIVTFIIYKVFVFIKGTRAIHLISGLIIILFAYHISKRFDLFMMGWILDNFVSSIIIIIIIIFQNDIRRVLLAIGRNPFFKRITYVDETLFYDELADACVIMGKRKIGALIVIEREVGLEEFMEIGIKMDAEVNTELLLSIFQPSSPIHDGALIIREGRIRAASSILPLTLKSDLDKRFGTRHRAAIGITEVTDAVALVVSEENGQISYAYKGEIETGIDGDKLKETLKKLLR